MSRQSERAREHREQTGQLRIGERRLAGADVPDELSTDAAFLQKKLATKRSAIRALEDKVKRLEAALRAGWTWQQYQESEESRKNPRGAP